MLLTIPSTLKLSQLKILAFKCGILTSGTKPILIRRLQDEISQIQNDNVSSTIKTTKKVRVLSIDMGIRNLAYCILDVPSKTLRRPGSNTRRIKTELPSIHAWHRLAVSSPPIANSITDIETPLPKEAFDPETLSQAAYTLLRTRLLPAKPTHILIERQRFRSMGSSHILEWTVRVNMFESILYAVLCTLKSEGLWDGSVRSVLPGKVGPFWISEEVKEGSEVGGQESGQGKGRKKVRNTASVKIKNKGAKIDLVRSWLESGDMVDLGNEEVTEMARRYAEKWDRVPGGRKVTRKLDGELEEKMGKLDDLADCLLQGMAWIQWEENKRSVMKYGVDVLLDP
ncbi:hypothetical protein VTL71DRAFT_7802 [Oculimacula yallundae]|uniref:SAP domain-containing protein n=1 Tax=Oculimacula yallundae TaxID=86028 RepID=A0ABR4CVT4_9HELO